MCLIVFVCFVCASQHAQASVDSHIIVRELREETKELRALPEVGLDDGIGLWRHLRLFLQDGSNIPIFTLFSFEISYLHNSDVEPFPTTSSPVGTKHSSTAASQHPEV